MTPLHRYVILLCLLVFSGTVCIIGGRSPTQVSVSYTPTNSNNTEEADKSFRSAILSLHDLNQDIDLNFGITIDQAKPLNPDGTTSNYAIDFAVFNHSDEPITFPDQGFGIKIFRYDRVHEQWHEVSLSHAPRILSITLPPKTEKWDMEIGNFWTIWGADLETITYKEFRIYIQGKGDLSMKMYGAYLDVAVP
jgi:hypothetical protein